MVKDFINLSWHISFNNSFVCMKNMECIEKDSCRTWCSEKLTNALKNKMVYPQNKYCYTKQFINSMLVLFLFRFSQVWEMLETILCHWQMLKKKSKLYINVLIKKTVMDGVSKFVIYNLYQSLWSMLVTDLYQPMLKQKTLPIYSVTSHPVGGWTGKNSFLFSWDSKWLPCDKSLLFCCYPISIVPANAGVSWTFSAVKGNLFSQMGKTFWTEKFFSRWSNQAGEFVFTADQFAQCLALTEFPGILVN